MSFLDELVTSARARAERLRSSTERKSLVRLATLTEAPRGFAAALAGPGLSVIAEIKRASPSKGPLAPKLDPVHLAKEFAASGAAAISVLTDPGFEGSLDDLEAARGAGLPVLRKDFIVDPLQVLESRAAGADAVLLIARVVGEGLSELLKATEGLGMAALVEIHDEEEIAPVLSTGARLIGINHRDLESFEVDADRTAKLRPLIPDEVTVVALSGISERAEVTELEAAGADAILVGESLVRSEDPGAKLRELLGR